MTPLRTQLTTGIAIALLFTSGCLSQADDRWSWEDFNRRDGQYSVAKTLVARKEPTKQPLFQIVPGPLANRNKARYEIFEEPDKSLGAFVSRPDRFPDDRSPFPGSNPGFDRPRPGIDNRRPGFNDRRPGFEPLNPDFNPVGPGFGVARPVVPGDRPFLENRPDFNRPGFDGNRPGFNGNRPGFINENRPGFVDGNRPNFGNFRPDLNNNRPVPGRPPIDFGPKPGINRPTPPSLPGGNAPGVLTGPVASWEKPHGPTNKDPTDFNTCKCKHSFNCKSPGIQFGSCDVGKVYCCYNSPKYGLLQGDGKRPILTGPRDLDPRIN